VCERDFVRISIGNTKDYIHLAPLSERLLQLTCAKSQWLMFTAVSYTPGVITPSKRPFYCGRHFTRQMGYRGVSREKCRHDVLEVIPVRTEVELVEQG
jgi:hypothetical protein